MVIWGIVYYCFKHTNSFPQIVAKTWYCFLQNPKDGTVTCRAVLSLPDQSGEVTNLAGIG